ncbi:MAG: ABC transporter substrate-binding protein [Desulfobacterium sp.]|nr:ABC transporter substrate-binding protein [Desulfobacterium sp.]
MTPHKSTCSILLSLFFLMTCPVTDCISKTATSGKIKNPDTFIEATRNSIETLDLHSMLSSATTCIAYNVYDSLLFNKPGQGIKPGLSTQVPTVENQLIRIRDDGKTTITFPIRKNVQFHDNTLLLPEDVKYTFTRAIIVGAKSNLCKPLTGMGSFQQLIKEKGLEAAYNAIDASITVQGNSVTFHLKRTFSPFLDIIADNGMAFGILSKKWCIQQGAWPGTARTVKDYVSLTADKNALHDKMMGTGPFKMVSWQKGERLILERFNAYWQGPAKLRRVIRQVITDNTVSVQYLQQGDVDFFCLGLPDLQKVQGYEGIRVVKDIPSSQLIKMNFNFDMQGKKYLGNGMLGNKGTPKDFFSDPDVRKGFCYAFDYETFINDVLLGAGRKPYGPVLIGFPTADPDTPQYAFDLEKAMEHLKKAHGGKVWEKGFTLKIPYNAGSTHRQRALEILKANLKQINPKFNLELTSLPWAAYVGAINDRKIPISIFGILPGYRHPYASLSYHMGSTDFYARVEGYSDLAREKYDPLIDAMTKTFDDEKVTALSHELQRLSHEDALAIFHYQVLGQVAMREWVKGYEVTALPFLVDYYQIHKE